METIKTYHYLNRVNLLTGPDDDIPRKIECLEFVMHAPSDYYRSNCPYPSGEPAPLPPGFIWTRLQMPKKKESNLTTKKIDILSRLIQWLILLSWVNLQWVEKLFKDWYIYFLNSAGNLCGDSLIICYFVLFLWRSDLFYPLLSP